MKRPNIRNYDGVWANPDWVGLRQRPLHVVISNGKSVWYSKDGSILREFDNIDIEMRRIDYGVWVSRDRITNHSTPTEDDTMNFVGEVAAPQPKVIGYVVRYERGGPDGGFSLPLVMGEHNGSAALFLPGWKEAFSLFKTEERAIQAIESSWQCQDLHGFKWNRMYGPYCIDTVTV